jgi:hypothetical protein
MRVIWRGASTCFVQQKKKFEKSEYLWFWVWENIDICSEFLFIASDGIQSIMLQNNCCYLLRRRRMPPKMAERVWLCGSIPWTVFPLTIVPRPRLWKKATSSMHTLLQGGLIGRRPDVDSPAFVISDLLDFAFKVQSATQK